jgi:hypothetical protein
MTTTTDVVDEVKERLQAPHVGPGVLLGAVCALLLMALVAFRVLFVTYIDNYELGYKFDARTGEISILPHTGYVVATPFVVSVHSIDLRPMQVCISAIQRVLNCKLVQFNPEPEAVKLFLSWHGRQDYDGPSTSSSQSMNGASQYTYFQNVLLNYAYDGSGKSYPFLTILREIKPDETSRK